MNQDTSDPVNGCSNLSSYTTEWVIIELQILETKTVFSIVLTNILTQLGLNKLANILQTFSKHFLEWKISEYFLVEFQLRLFLWIQ